MKDSEQCMRCGKSLVVHGSFSTTAGLGFRPSELRLFSLSFHFPDVPITAAACVACGLVWAETDVVSLRQKLVDLGNDDVRQRLGLLDGD